MNKNIIIGGLAFVIVLMFRVGIELKHNYDRELYAIKHNCKWSWEGTMYGDDRDFVCRGEKES